MSQAAIKRALAEDQQDDLDEYMATVGAMRLSEGGNPIPNDRRLRRIAKKYKRELIGDALLDRYAEGEFISKLLKEAGMPRWAVVQEWREENYYNFGVRYERAKRWHHESLADSMIPDIADHPTLDSRDKKVRLDIRRWALSKANPEKYGDQLKISGNINPISLNLSLELSTLSDAQLAALEQFTEASAAAKVVQQTGPTLDVPFEDVTDDEPE